MYILIKDAFTKTNIVAVQRIFDKACIPFDPNNTDYQEYLVWISEGNTPEPADELE